VQPIRSWRSVAFRIVFLLEDLPVAATNPPQFIRATREILLFFEENFAIINAEIVDEIRFATETS
jgi:hypothetical protein